MHTAETFYPADPHAPDAPAAERVVRLTRTLVLTAKVALRLGVLVYANHGRWVVDCCFCKSAQVASFSDRRMLCTDCGNVSVGGKWVEVVWPKNVGAIEAVLVVRPEINQNWHPGETVADLRRENADHASEVR